MTTQDTIIPTAVGVALGLFTLMGTADAAFTISASVGGTPTGSNINLANFDNLALGSAGGSSGGLGVAFSGGAETAQGLSSAHTPPFLSNSQGSAFGDPTVSGPDTTHYLSTGLGTVTMTLSQPATYFGLLWGSIDAFNSLLFYNNGTLVGTVTGSDVMANPLGNLGATGTEYVSILSSAAFTSAVAMSSGWSFEFDNVAYGPDPDPPAVPEPISVGLLGFGLLGMALPFCRYRGSAGAA